MIIGDNSRKVNWYSDHLNNSPQIVKGVLLKGESVFFLDLSHYYTRSGHRAYMCVNPALICFTENCAPT